MPDIPNYNFNSGGFPIATVIDAAARNAALRQQAQQAGQESLVAGLKSIGDVGGSIYDRRVQMAQALATAKMYANTPEGQAMLAPTTTTNTINAPVTRRSTAAYDPSTGNVTPNTGMSGVGTVMPQPVTTSTPSPVSMQDLQTAFRGESPANLLQQLFERQKTAQELALKGREVTLKEATEPAKVAGELAIQRTGLGIKAGEAATAAGKAQSEDINTLLQRRQEATTKLPTGWWNAINNDQAEQAKQEIANIDSQLAAKGYKGTITPPTKSPSKAIGSQKYTTDAGTSYTVNPGA